ncbi:HU family DNA-binding protein [Streptomyces sp. NPDC006296]|uniref:HU family DNA-binding protein n=1 Tax=Streptomyces sp. NPDC006296 TaxID=3156746 RepID=UPI0033B8607E
MDRSGLIDAVGRRTAGGGELSPEQVGRVVDALFGTVARAGAIAETLRTGGAVTLVGFGSFHQEDGAAALRPGKALNEFVNGEVGRVG